MLADLLELGTESCYATPARIATDLGKTPSIASGNCDLITPLGLAPLAFCAFAGTQYCGSLPGLDLTTGIRPS